MIGLGLIVASLIVPREIARLKAGEFVARFNSTGSVESLLIGDHDNLIPSGRPSPLISLKVDGKILLPKAAEYDAKSQTFQIDFAGHRAQVRTNVFPSHLAFELKAVRPSKDVELVIWGPFPSTLKESVGETIGVVQGQGLAFGLQVLNAKTLGGFPNTEDDIEPSYDIFETGNLVDMNDKDAATENYRGDTARPTEFGSVVQAYTRNRSKTRVIENWGHKHYTAPAYRDGGVTGSKIALFGCQASEALETIGRIEIQEGLPHPIMDGVWGKISPTAHESYLVMGYDSKNLDECLAITKAAGLRYLYTDGGFESWGHFKLDPKGFPNNWQSMKECVERAKKQGILIGIHTLSNFITTNDAYVTPVPDRRLAEVGASKLVGAINSTQTEIGIQDPMFFNQMSNNTLRTVRIDDELIQYDSVSESSPWTLHKCTRGAFGTKSSDHRSGVKIAKLMDHGYKTFLTNADLTKDVARNIAHLFNETGMRQVSMDGLEGNWSTGMGQYGRALFAETLFDNLSPELRGEVINDASNPGAFNWHFNTRMNWGEPWYAGFRKSQTLYRLKNQHYFKRNLMPGMLGWFQLTSETTLEDIQWLLARAAGFDAGFCITASLDSIHKNPNLKEILGAVKAWESARRAHAFPAHLASGLQDINREFELSQEFEKTWSITEIRSTKFAVGTGVKELPFEMGEWPAGAKLILQVPKGGELADGTVEVDGTPVWNHQGSAIHGYQHLVVDLSKLKPGSHRLKFTGKFTGEKGVSIDGEVRVALGEAQPLHAR